MPSFIFINPTVWQQYTNVTDRQQTDRQDNSPIAQGKPFYKESLKNKNYQTVTKPTNSSYPIMLQVQMLEFFQP